MNYIAYLGTSTCAETGFDGELHHTCTYTGAAEYKDGAKSKDMY